jgi:hypothetical protein
LKIGTGTTAKKNSSKPWTPDEDERLRALPAQAPMVAPTPELPDDMPIERILFSTRTQNALRAADLKTVGEVREISDETLISLPDFGSSLSASAGNWACRRPMGLDPISKKSPPDLRRLPDPHRRLSRALRKRNGGMVVGGGAPARWRLVSPVANSNLSNNASPGTD